MTNYNELNELQQKLINIDSENERQKFIDNLTTEQIKHLNFKMGYLSSKIRSTKKMLKDARIDRTTNYDRLIKKSKLLFDNVDIEILEMIGDDDMCWYARGILDRVNDNSTGEKFIAGQIKASLRLLKRRGLVEVVNGLFDDDGYIAGSGYTLVYKHRQIISKIIYSYNGGTNQEKLEI